MRPPRRPRTAPTRWQTAFDKLTTRTFLAVLFLALVATLWLGPTEAMARLAGAL